MTAPLGTARAGARNILFVTTDQQRYDAFGCNGGGVARTPVVDALAAAGINYRRAYCQNTLCMPARSTILTGQYVRTHGVLTNGVALPEDAPSVAAYLRQAAGYTTALFGKAHFEPGRDPELRWAENRRAHEGETGDWRGFDTSIQAMHVPATDIGPALHYGYWLERHHPEHLASFSSLFSAEPEGESGAPQAKRNPIPRDWYHTDWVADRAVEWLDALDADDRFFCWVSFPDPHHPWDPPASELGRVDWRDLDLPPGHPGTPDAIREVLGRKPAHWLGTYDGSWRNLEGAPAAFAANAMTHDQVREINARTHVMNELIDEAIGRVLACLRSRGVLDDTDVIVTTDHGELQGDFGLLFKGPYHSDALLRLPLVWRPAPNAAVPSGVEISTPVGQVDLAPTFCRIAGVEPAPWMHGQPLPTSTAVEHRGSVVCEWDSKIPHQGMHIRTIVSDGWMCTTYEPSTGGQPNGLEGNALVESLLGPLAPVGVQYDGSEGELYALDDDPYQRHNRWDDRAVASVKAWLLEELRATLDDLPRRHLPVETLA